MNESNIKTKKQRKKGKHKSGPKITDTKNTELGTGVVGIDADIDVDRVSKQASILAHFVDVGSNFQAGTHDYTVVSSVIAASTINVNVYVSGSHYFTASPTSLFFFFSFFKSGTN